MLGGFSNVWPLNIDLSNMSLARCCGVSAIVKPSQSILTFWNVAQYRSSLTLMSPLLLM